MSSAGVEVEEVEEEWVPPPYHGEGERPHLRIGDIVETIDPDSVAHYLRTRGKVPHGVVVGANLEGSLGAAMFGHHKFTVVVAESAGISHVTDQRSHQFRVVRLDERTHVDRVRAVIHGWRPPAEPDPGSAAEDRFLEIVSDVHNAIMDAVGSPESLHDAIASALKKHAWRFADDDETWEWQMLSALCPPLWWDDIWDWPDINELAIMAAESYDESEKRITQKYEQRIADLELELNNIRETLKARDRIETPWP